MTTRRPAARGWLRRVRSTARRGALLGLDAAYTVRGVPREADAQPGFTVLLLHNTPPPLLRRLLDFVDRRPGRILGFADATATLTGGGPSAPGVALTFDDGFASNMAAARALASRGVSACFYLPTDVIGLDDDAVDRFFRRPQAEGAMTWDDVEELRTLGHVVGSHCKQHLPLADMSLAAAEDQVKGSVDVLRDRLGEVGHFAWPFGALSHAPVEAVRGWCREIDVLPASGVRGRNTPELLQRRGYLSRDAVDLRWLAADYRVFTSRSHRRLV